MKKKTIICMLVLCCTMLPVMAGGPKTYISMDYKGEALAEFLPSKNGILIRPNGEFQSISEVCDMYETELGMSGMILEKKTKLTKEENFLIWSALNEYELLDGEVYFVAISTPPYTEALSFLVMITDNGNGYTWYGGWQIKGW